MQNKNVAIGLIVLLVVLVGVALVNRDKFMPAQNAMMDVTPTTVMTAPPSEPTDNTMMMQKDATAPDTMGNRQTQTAHPIGTITQDSSTVTLTAQNGSNQTGTATLEETNGKVVVTLNMTGGTFTSPQPAHIHLGSCPTPGEIVYPLSNVVNGKSTTTINTTIANLKSQEPLAINVHKSAAEVKVYTSCGDLSL